MSRIFTFGCSFTSYSWPTWADIILYGNEGYNCGLTGGGFESILFRLMEANRIFKFTSNDNVIVVLTTPLRWDIILNKTWNSYGQVTNNPKLNKYEGKLYSIDGLVYKSFYTIQLIKEYLECRNINHIFGSVNNIYENLGNYFETIAVTKETDNLINYIKNKVNIELTDFKSYISKEKKWMVTKKFEDSGELEYHPRPLTHYNWVKDVLLNKMDITLKASENQIIDIEKHIDSLNHYEEINKIINFFPEFYKNKLDDRIYFEKTNIKLI